eukprot:6481572-Amphidinium_carterae.2
MLVPFLSKGCTCVQCLGSLSQSAVVLQADFCLLNMKLLKGGLGVQKQVIHGFLVCVMLGFIAQLPHIAPFERKEEAKEVLGDLEGQATTQ